MPFNLNDGIKKYTGLGGNDGLSSWFGRTPGIGLQDSERSWLKQRPYDISDGILNDMWYSFLRADGYTGTINDMMSAYWAAPSRVIPTLAGSQYGTIDTPITFAGDFDIEFFGATTVAANTATTGLFGQNGTTIDYAQLQDGAGKLGFVTTDGVTAIVKSDHLDGKLHKYNFKRTGLTVSIDVDGTEVVTNTLAAASTVTIDLVLSLFVGAITRQYIGEASYLKFTDQSGAEDVVTNFVFDSGSTTDQPSRGGGNNVTLVNFATTDWNRYTKQRNILHDAGTISEAWVGDNLVVNGTFDADTDWTKGANWSIGSGVASAIGATSFISQSAIPLNTKDRYLFKHSCLSYTSGTVATVLNGATTNVSSPLRSAAGEYVDLLVGNADGNGNISISGVALTCSVDNVSVQQVLEVA